MMKKQNGITLIALIITIIVMLILVAVTLILALGENGIITNAINANEEHKIAAFKECVEIAASGNYDPEYTWKGVEGVTGRYDFITIQNEIKQQYPNVKFTYNLSSLPQGATSANIKGLLANEGLLYAANETYDFIERTKWSGKITTAQKNLIQKELDDAKQRFITEEIEKRWPNMAEEYKQLITVEDISLKLSTSSQAGTIKAALLLNESLIGPMSSMMAEYKGVVVPIGFVNSNMYDYYIIMNQTEAEALFEITYTTEDGRQIATINRYKGNSKNVKVPGTLIEDKTGEPILVNGIASGAFSKLDIKASIINLISGSDMNNTDYDELLYNETATLGEFKEFFEVPEDIYYCEHTELGDACTSKLCKNEILKIAILMLAQEENIPVTEENIDDYLVLDSEKTLYVYLRVVDMDTGEMFPITPSEFQESKVRTVIVSEGIQTMGDYIFTNCINLKEIYLPASLEDIGDDIFNLCSSLTTLKTMNEDIAESTDDYGCPNDFERIYIEGVIELN